MKTDKNIATITPIFQFIWPTTRMVLKKDTASGLPTPHEKPHNQKWNVR